MKIINDPVSLVEDKYEALLTKPPSQTQRATVTPLAAISHSHIKAIWKYYSKLQNKYHCESLDARLQCRQCFRQHPRASPLGGEAQAPGAGGGCLCLLFRARCAAIRCRRWLCAALARRARTHRRGVGFTY